MSDTTTQRKHRTITLTGRRPVRITENEWPVIALAHDSVSTRNGTPLPDYESAYWRLTVRQHADARVLVYAVADAPSCGWPNHEASDYRGGELLDPGSDIVAAIERVGARLVEHGGAPESIVRECIADLPAEEI